jgi:cephalosporin-C deacetylase-like acetyl esterase
VTPNHADWKYAAGENAIFTVKVALNDSPAAGLKVNWTVGPDQMEPIRKGETVLGADGTAAIDAGTRPDPGFLRLNVTVQGEGRSYTGLCTVGFDPEKIQPVTKEPADFDAFWEEQKAVLAKIPINAQRTPYPEKTTDTLNAYEVSFQTVAGPSNRGASRIYGILTEPKAPGKYPAFLRVPGAGVYGVSGIVKEADENMIVLSIGIHGIPLTLPAAVYNSISRGAIDMYQVQNMDSKDRYYYRRVYLGAVRAVDYLASLENWDGKSIGVIGSSQGGALSIVTAALHPKVTTLASIHPALSDVAGTLAGRAGGWPEIFKDVSYRTPANIETMTYYDVVNFAKRVKVPGIYSWGYNDTTCAPTTTYAAYNAIRAPKVLTLELPTGHTMTPGQTARIKEWFLEFLRTGVQPASVKE